MKKEIGVYKSISFPNPPLPSQTLMTHILDLEKLALTKQPMPKGMSLAEIGFFYTVKVIGSQYHCGSLSEVDAYTLLQKYINELYKELTEEI